MANSRTNILDMYVVYLEDEMTEDRQKTNELVVLTCSSYVIFDDRSPSERSRIPTEKMVEQIEANAYRSCNALIDSLIKKNDKKSLRLIQSRLAHNECLDKITKFLSERKENVTPRPKVKIEI